MGLRATHLARWWAQNQRCIWCGGWTWAAGLVTEHHARQRLGITPGMRGAGKALRRARATAEHLLPRARGGTDRADNIVSACAGCNTRRGDDPARLAPHAEVLALLPVPVRRQILWAAEQAQIRPSESDVFGRSDDDFCLDRKIK